MERSVTIVMTNQSVNESKRTEGPPMQKAQRKSRDFRGPVGEFAELQSAIVGDEGLEEPLEIPKEKRFSEIGGARGGAMRPDATLIELSECWPHLPEQIRLKIMKLVRSMDSTNTARS